MRSFLRRGQLAFLFFVAIQFGGAVSQAQSPKNLILFIPDGLRRGSVTPNDSPVLARVRDQGINFANSHSIFPTLTMVNTAAMGTSHFPGDTGNFANTVYRWPKEACGRWRRSARLFPLSRSSGFFGPCSWYWDGLRILCGNIVFGSR